MTTKLPISMIADGTPMTLIGRDSIGQTVERPFPAGKKYGEGMYLSKVDSTKISISPGYRNGRLFSTGLFSNSITKNTSQLFAQGNNNGSLDSGVISNETFYYVHAIINGLNVDIITSLSAKTPTVPSGWNYICRLGTIYINANNEIEDFNQIGNYFAFKRPFDEFLSYASVPAADGYPVAVPITQKMHLPKQVNLIADINLGSYASGHHATIFYYVVDSNTPVSASGSLYWHARSVILWTNFRSGVSPNFQVSLKNNDTLTFYWYMTGARQQAGTSYFFARTNGWYDMELGI